MHIIQMFGAAMLVWVLSATAYAGDTYVYGIGLNDQETVAKVLANNDYRNKQDAAVQACNGSSSKTGCDIGVCTLAGTLWNCNSNGSVHCTSSRSTAAAKVASVFNPADDSEAGVDAVPQNQIVQEKCYKFPVTDPDELRKSIFVFDHGRGYRADLAYSVHQRILVVSPADHAQNVSVERDLPVVTGFGERADGCESPSGAAVLV